MREDNREIFLFSNLFLLYTFFYNPNGKKTNFFFKPKRGIKPVIIIENTHNLFNNYVSFPINTVLILLFFLIFLNFVTRTFF
jgi:hypothetical protein